MRAAPIYEPYATAIDEEVLQVTQDILDFKEPWTEQRKLQLFTPKKQGGGGMGTMVGRMRPAWLGGWESGLAPVARTVGIRSMTELQNGWPQLMKTINKFENQHAEMTGKDPPPLRNGRNGYTLPRKNSRKS